ncbi:MAG: hypothetical protein WDW38_003146 [Sanguina aurantia]
MGNSSSSAAGSASPADKAPPSNTVPSSTINPACPIPEEYRNPAIYNVYGERLNGPATLNPITSAWKSVGLVDPSNNMPLEPNQQPCAGQRKLLPVERVHSNIPKGGTDTNWTYPSPQMVFNALRRKGKGDDVTEDDMQGFVNAHNSMNEATWQQVAMWERLHTDSPSQATLLKFEGKPHDLSPIAWIRHKLGGPLPFDRHDWTVDRGGKEVRYVIDFYFYEDKAGTPDAFEMTTRPACDSFDACLDRVKMGIYIKFAEWGLPILSHVNSCPPASVADEAF